MYSEVIRLNIQIIKFIRGVIMNQFEKNKKACDNIIGNLPNSDRIDNYINDHGYVDMTRYDYAKEACENYLKLKSRYERYIYRNKKLHARFGSVDNMLNDSIYKIVLSLIKRSAINFFKDIKRCKSHKNGDLQDLQADFNQSQSAKDFTNLFSKAFFKKLGNGKK